MMLCSAAGCSSARLLLVHDSEGHQTDVAAVTSAAAGVSISNESFVDGTHKLIEDAQYN